MEYSPFREHSRRASVDSKGEDPMEEFQALDPGGLLGEVWRENVPDLPQIIVLRHLPTLEMVTVCPVEFSRVELTPHGVSNGYLLTRCSMTLGLSQIGTREAP